MAVPLSEIGKAPAGAGQGPETEAGPESETATGRAAQRWLAARRAVLRSCRPPSMRKGPWTHLYGC